MSVKRILIVDDDAEFCEELEQALKSEGFLAECISNVLKAKSAIRNNSYDLVLLDYKMPGMTGKEILKTFKKSRIPKNIFIITGKPLVEDELKKEGLLASGMKVISKPVNFGALLEEIRNL